MVRRRERWRRYIPVVVAGLMALWTGCSFRSGLGDLECDAQSGPTDGRTCQNGYWVVTTDATGADGGPDGGTEQCNYRGEAVGVCSDGTVGPEGDCQPPPTFSPIETRCTDGLDNDCDGEIDKTEEACQCTPGEEETCYSGPGSTRGVGICTAGMRTCSDLGVWKECKGETTPAASEDCDTSADEDCRGDVNAGCPCNFEGKSDGVCGNASLDATGNCKRPAAFDGTDDENAAGNCDDVDNDCDGVADENCSCQYKNRGEGVCATATIDPGTGQCQQPSGFNPEDNEKAAGVCDLQDNDCDGSVDENCECSPPGRTKDFYNGPGGTKGTGVCRAGQLTCTDDGTWETTRPERTPTPEQCNNRDDDCNGQTDDGLSRRCYSPQDDSTAGVGICERGTQTCSNGRWGACMNETTPESEKCNNKDDNCNGQTDENLFRECYTGPQGTKGVGVCRAGNEVCAMGSWSSCQMEQTPGSEQCDDPNGNDEDCDGQANCADGECDGKQCDGSGTTCLGRDSHCHETNCGDGNDNDGDGDTDCDDSDCASTNQCVESNCSDGNDNDGDGNTDCGDSDCTGSQCNGSGTICRSGDGDCHETACEDGNDNDGDGDTDCDDGDCSSCPDGTTCSSGACVESACSDRTDNDGDGDADCNDDDCSSCPSGSVCSSQGACLEDLCDDGMDNDNDGDTDCDDGDCAGGACGTGSGASCQSSSCVETACDDNNDNDGDGDTDCDDSDCSGASSCNTESNCEDGNDNDNDGDTDCADSDCSGQACGNGSGATCQSSTCVENDCGDNNDNDDDGDTDCDDSDCAGTNTCTESNCEDGNDNDGDGDTDCDDDDCNGMSCGGGKCCGGSGDNSCDGSNC